MKFRFIFFYSIAALMLIATFVCCSESDSREVSYNSKSQTSEINQNQTSDITWYGYDEGMALGKKEGKKLLLHFYADWCVYCKKMDKEIFSQKDAADFINKNFIPIRLNSDVDTQLAEAYHVSGLPTTCFLDQNGENIKTISGYLPKEMFMAYMKYIQTDSYRNMTFRAFMGVE